MTTTRAVSLFVAGTLLGVPFGACSRSSRAGSPMPTPPSEVTVTMREYAFEVDGRLGAGRVVFRVANGGREPHMPVLVALDDTLPPIAEDVKSPEPHPLRPLAGVNPRGPGRTGTFAVDLDAGRRYALICEASTADGTPHAQKGMTWEMRAGSYAIAGIR